MEITRQLRLMFKKLHVSLQLQKQDRYSDFVTTQQTENKLAGRFRLHLFTGRVEQ